MSEPKTSQQRRVRVAVDSLDMHDVHIKEAEQSALAEQALAQFEATQAQQQIGAGTVDVPYTQSSSVPANKERGK